jgi:hypothetical protein
MLPGHHNGYGLPLTCSTYQQAFYNVLGVDQENASDKEKLNFLKVISPLLKKT